MQTYKMRIVIAIILMAGFGGVCLAQPPGGPMGGAKAKEKIQQLKKIKLLDILSLDESTSEKFLAKYSVIEKKIEEKRMAMNKMADELTESLKKGESKDVISQKTQALVKMQEEFAREAMESQMSMKSILNDVEFAKFVVFELKFREEFIKIMFDRLKNKQGKMQRQQLDD